MLKLRSCIRISVLSTVAMAAGLGGDAVAQISRLPAQSRTVPSVNPYARQPTVVRDTRIGDFKVIADRPLRAVSSPVAAQLNAAKLAEKNGELEAATKAYRDALAAFPNDRKVLVNFARFKHRSGDLDGAIVTYTQCLKHHSNDAVALNDLGLCFSRKGEMQKATKCVESAIRVNPQSKRYRNNLATLLVESDELDRAEAVLSDVHGKAIGNYNLGHVLSRRERQEEAIPYLRAAVKLDPTLQPARQLLAEISAGLESAKVLTARAPATSATQGGELDPTVRSVNSAAHYEEQAGRVQPPEIDAYPIPGMKGK